VPGGPDRPKADGARAGPAGGIPTGGGGMIPVGGGGGVGGRSQLQAALHQTASQNAQMASSEDESRRRRDYVRKQQQWLLFLRHCAKCHAPPGECQYGANCVTAKKLWTHIIECREPRCSYPRCAQSRELLRHHSKCASPQCPICVPVKMHVDKMRRQEQAQAQAQAQARGRDGAGTGPGGPPDGLGGEGAGAGAGRGGAPPGAGRGRGAAGPRPGVVKLEAPPGAGPGGGGMRVGVPGLAQQAGGAGPDGHAGNARKRGASEAQLRREEAAKRQKIRAKHVIGTSGCEFMDQDQLTTHIASLRSQDPMKTNRLLAMREVQASPDMCPACGESKRVFEPPTLFCFCCQQRIKRNQVMFVAPPEANIVDVGRPSLCNACFTQQKGDKVKLEGLVPCPKAAFVKKKNEEDSEEPWVQCDICESWIHQVCGLFNKGRNKNGESEYMCPHCLKEAIRNGMREPGTERPRSFWTAEMLPKCKMSDFLEERLLKTLEEERSDRAKSLGLPPEAVPAASDLTIRVVQASDKRCEVKPNFAEHFCENHGYPRHFDYRQKVLVLFQKIEGVDVLLFCMYVHEYGAREAPPNQRVVYLSYLDSVKYMRPELDACNRPGMSIRTMVYCDILEGYLEWVKLRGFTSMYIWACPPMAGDDYIMHCHPSRQKTPQAAKLREWYLKMLKSCYDRGIVHSVTNLFDLFFAGGKEHRLETASMTHIPYLDGDYWPAEAETIMSKIGAEARGGAGGSQKKQGTKARKASKGKRSTGPATTDAQLMAKLGDSLQSMRFDFIVANLIPSCSFCRKFYDDEEYMALPERVSLPASTNAMTTSPQALRNAFSLCGACFDGERTRLDNQGVLPVDMAGLKSLPTGVELSDLAAKRAGPLPRTEDLDKEMSCEFFDTRQTFLNLCQGNHFQFDTLRRAKHSSMMVVYHLHNPEEPAFASNCNGCQLPLEPGEGWRCTQCKDFDMCNKCKNKHGHEHRLVPSHGGGQGGGLFGGGGATSEERRQRLAQTLALIEHAASCQLQPAACPEKLCRKIRQLFLHAHKCEQDGTLLSCNVCRRLLQLVSMHARQCKKADCQVPKCKDFKVMMQRKNALNAQNDAARRKAYRQLQQGGG